MTLVEERRTTAVEAEALVREIENLVEEHDGWRGRTTVNLNAANNVLSPAARRVLATRLADKGISGGLGRRHHMGGRVIDEIESRLVEVATRVFRASFVEYRPASGSLANALAIASVLERDDPIMVLGEGAPGHQSYRRDGWGGRLQSDVTDLPFDDATLDIDTAAFRRIAQHIRPRLIVVGSALLLFPYDLRPIREVADEVGALVMYDGAHAMGLFAGGAFQDPLREGADLVTGSTQKSLPGPIGGLVLTNRQELGDRVFDVSTRLVSNYENNRVAALAVALTEMLAFGSSYARACIANARTFAAALADQGFTPLGAARGYTASNQVILDVGEAATALTERWEAAQIITTAMHLPSTKPTRGRQPDGVRLGVQELTRLGMGADEMARIALLMRRVVNGEDPQGAAGEAVELVRAFPTVYYCFEHPTPATA